MLLVDWWSQTCKHDIRKGANTFSQCITMLQGSKGETGVGLTLDSKMGITFRDLLKMTDFYSIDGIFQCTYSLHFSSGLPHISIPTVQAQFSTYRHLASAVKWKCQIQGQVIFESLFIDVKVPQSCWPHITPLTPCSMSNKVYTLSPRAT